jgi:hypothetical protein
MDQNVVVSDGICAEPENEERRFLKEGGILEMKAAGSVGGRIAAFCFGGVPAHERERQAIWFIEPDGYLYY